MDSVLWLDHLFGGFPSPAAILTGFSIHTFIVSFSGRARPYDVLIHALNLFGHVASRFTYFCSKSSSVSQSTKPFVRRPFLSPPRILPMISFLSSPAIPSLVRSCYTENVMYITMREGSMSITNQTEKPLCLEGGGRGERGRDGMRNRTRGVFETIRDRRVTLACETNPKGVFSGVCRLQCDNMAPTHSLVEPKRKAHEAQSSQNTNFVSFRFVSQSTISRE